MNFACVLSSCETHSMSLAPAPRSIDAASVLSAFSYADRVFSPASLPASMMRSLSLRIRCATASSRGSPVLAAELRLALEPLERVEPELLARARVPPELERLADALEELERLALEEVDRLALEEAERFAVEDPPELERPLDDDPLAARPLDDDPLAARLVPDFERLVLDDPPDFEPALLLG